MGKLFPDFCHVWGDKTIAGSSLEHIKKTHIDGVELLLAYVEEHWLQAKIIKNAYHAYKPSQGNNWFFIYDKKVLQKKIDDNKVILEKHDIACDADAFITWIATHFAFKEDKPELSRFIASCFNKEELSLRYKDTHAYKKEIFDWWFSLDEDF